MSRILKNNHILTACVMALSIICYLSIKRPMMFEEERKQRENAVKERLMKIRQAEEMYRKDNGTYTGDFSTLVKRGYMADSLQYIPYSEGSRFDISTTVITGKSGRNIPLMECAAKYNEYLKGLDENAIANLIEDANNSGKYPGLKIGDIITPNNNAGNWE